MAEVEQDTSEDLWLTLVEIADELRLSPATIRSWISKGTLRAMRAGQRKWFVRRSELDRMLNGEGFDDTEEPPVLHRSVGVGYAPRHRFPENIAPPGSIDWDVTEDLIGLMAGTVVAIEVELAPKSKPRLDAIVNLHPSWIIGGKTHGVIYVCGDEEGCRRVARAGDRVGLYSTSRHLRIETLETIKAQTLTAYAINRTVDEPAAA